MQNLAHELERDLCQAQRHALQEELDSAIDAVAVASMRYESAMQRYHDVLDAYMWMSGWRLYVRKFINYWRKLCS